MDANKKKIADLTIKRIDLVYVNAKNTAKMFKTDSISIKSFQGVCSDLKVPVENDGNKEFMTNLNDVFDTIADACWKFAETNNSAQIPLEYVKIVVEQAKKSLKEVLV